MEPDRLIKNTDHQIYGYRRKWFAWASRLGFGFRLRWVEVQIYWYGWRGDR